MISVNLSQMAQTVERLRNASGELSRFSETLNERKQEIARQGYTDEIIRQLSKIGDDVLTCGNDTRKSAEALERIRLLYTQSEQRVQDVYEQERVVTSNAISEKSGLGRRRVPQYSYNVLNLVRIDPNMM